MLSVSALGHLIACPTVYRAVLAHPPRTINGRFRVTEQGEMITQNFGSTGIAERTMVTLSPSFPLSSSALSLMPLGHAGYIHGGRAG